MQPFGGEPHVLGFGDGQELAKMSKFHGDSCVQNISFGETDASKSGRFTLHRYATNRLRHIEIFCCSDAYAFVRQRH